MIANGAILTQYFKKAHIIQTIAIIYLTPLHDIPTQNFEAFIRLSTEWTSQFLKNTIVIQEPLTTLEEFIIQICSDGGVRNLTAAFGMVFSLNYNIISTTGIRLQNEYSNISSHRCEAFGLLSALIIYNRFQEYLERSGGSRIQVQPKFFCDNKALVSTMNKFKYSSIPTKFFQRRCRYYKRNLANY
jgi:hypothetical protein